MKIPLTPILFAILLAASAYATNDPPRPATYADFLDVTQFKSLAEAVVSAKEIYLPAGRYLIDNPLVIDRDLPLFIHGADRRNAILVGRNPGKPLILIKRAPAVGLAGLRLIANEDPNSVDQIAIQTMNTTPLWLEILDSTVDDAGLEFRGPGTNRIQAVSFFPHGRVTTSILVNHPDAIVTLVGGNISNNHSPVRISTSQASHIWQRQGRLQIFGTAFQATVGPSDIRIDTPSTHGPHIIAGVRSEGSNGGNQGEYPALLLRVPSTPLPVDVLVEGNIAAWTPLGRDRGTLVEYGGSGSLWLIGNNGLSGIGSLVGGNTSRAHVLAVGNLVFGRKPITPSSTAVARLGANLFAHRSLTSSMEKPYSRFLPPGLKLPTGMQPVPRSPVPPPLTRPTLTSALPGMVNVRSFGAKGDGIQDDTLALQRALDAGCGKVPMHLFLPAGTYRITDTLRFIHAKTKCSQHKVGGWIAGEGSSRTIIRRDGGGGGVFATQGMAYTTIQGITFQTRPYRASDRSPVKEAAVSLEYTRSVGYATQAISFYDVRFDGGLQALAIGVKSPEQCSENLLVDATFANAHMGLAVGAYNALSNIVYRGRFDANDITMGQPEFGLSGGTWMVLGATVRGTRDRELNLRNSANGVWYLNGVDSDTPRLVSAQGTSAAFPILIEQSVFRPRPRSPSARFIDFGATGGVIFLHSALSKLIPSRIGGGIASSYLLSIDSQLTDLEKVTVLKNAVVSQNSPQ